MTEEPPESGEASAALPRDLARALAWLRQHPQEPVQLDTLAAVAGVRPRTLETHFKQFLGVTPLGWVRRMRLARARQMLARAEGEDSVTQIALANGFGQLGRFAAQYRQHFGELPSATLRRVKGAPSSGDDRADDEACRLTWQAIPAAFAVAPDQCGAALEDLARAHELAPGYALAKALAAWCLSQRAAHRFSATQQADRQVACRLATEASTLGHDDAMTLSVAGGAFVLANRVEAGDRLVERALALDPYSPFAWIRRGWLSAYQGDSENAIRELKISLRLMPFEPLKHLMLIGIGAAHFNAGRYDVAARWVQSGTDAYPGSFWAERITIAAAVHAGARAEARRAARRVLRRDPDLTVDEARHAWPFPPDFMARLADGLVAAGVPRA
jgi:AraC-like DNA-binding protein